MGKCSYTWEEWDDEKGRIERSCPHDTWEGSDEFCIFHDPSPDKDRNLFIEKLKEQMKSENEKHSFIGYVFPEDWDYFKNYEFKINTCFEKSIFQENAYFTKATFQKNTYFYDTTFHGDADFRKANFQEDAYFKEVTFQDVNFKEAVFQDVNFEESTFQDADFSKVTFQNADFKEVIFQGNVNFYEATFQNADFWEAKFQEKADFEGVTFQDVDFSEATFQNTDFGRATFRDVDFIGTTFKGNLDFYETIFRDANFEETSFLKSVSFNEVIFHGFADFGKATFQENVYFGIVTFNRFADFEEVNFQGYADFSEATFQNADFTGATFQDADFGRATFHKQLNFEPKKINILDLQYSQFFFRSYISADLSKTLFHRAFLDNVTFVNCTWPKKYIIYEEQHVKNEDINLGYKELETIYRNLKQNIQNNGDYSTAGEFYYREMEMRRKKNNWKIRSRWWLELYHFIAGYGEKPQLVIRNSFLVIFIAALLFFFNGVIRTNIFPLLEKTPYIINYSLHSVDFNIQALIDFGYCFYYSIVTFTTLGYGDIHPLGLSHVIASIEALIGAFFMALFVVVFVRKMAR